ncbi:hypothetical protein ACIQF5_28225 [Streptomyces goshikiensis]|uniref:hypothetical protein n=1 Tax=Streptomyces goshikiensis TaxID=1942 RepID=UPI003823243F
MHALYAMAALSAMRASLPMSAFCGFPAEAAALDFERVHIGGHQACLEGEFASLVDIHRAADDVSTPFMGLALAERPAGWQQQFQERGLNPDAADVAGYGVLLALRPAGRSGE